MPDSPAAPDLAPLREARQPRRAGRWVSVMALGALLLPVPFEGRTFISCVALSPARSAEEVTAAASASAAPVEQRSLAPSPQPSASPSAAPGPPPPPPVPPLEAARSWLAARAPKAATVSIDGPTVVIEHKIQPADTWDRIAASYVELTELSLVAELRDALFKANPKQAKYGLFAGQKMQVPRVFQTVPRPIAEQRLGWPTEDQGALRGIYATAPFVGQPNFHRVLDRLAQVGINALVVDIKDVTGLFTYPTRVPLALEARADRRTTLRSLSALVRAAHLRDIRVIGRLSCFRDELIAPLRTEMAVQRRGGGVFRSPGGHIDWLDPGDERAQNYLLEIVDEALAEGIDELQLDYVRYPTEWIRGADFQLEARGTDTVTVITKFVERVHAKTAAQKVPLSLDIFGVVAWGHEPDLRATGQDIRRLAPIVEALSPMVYPSHFSPGFSGFANPGDHPEVVGIGTHVALEMIRATGASTVVRPWVQAFAYKTTQFSPAYIAQQFASARARGAIGWLAWNSSSDYRATFAALPNKR